MSRPRNGTINLRAEHVTARVRVSNTSVDANRADTRAAAAILHEMAEAMWAGAGEPARPTIVCLCGSTRFWREFQAASLAETLAGRIVLSIGAASGTDDEHFGTLPREEYDRIKTDLDELHLRKVEMADDVLIVNRDGSIGESTARELAHAHALGKRVRFLEETDVSASRPGGGG